MYLELRTSVFNSHFSVTAGVEVLLASENRKKKKVKQETTQTELKEMFSVLRQHRARVVAEHDHAWSHINTILQGHHVEHLIPELLEVWSFLSHASNFSCFFF